MFYFLLHLSPQLPEADHFRQYVVLPVHLQVLSDALRAQQLDAVETHVPDCLGGVRLAVVATEGGGLSDAAGAGEERAGVCLSVSGLVGGEGRGAVEAGVLFVKEVHLQLSTLFTII